ncbi:MAG: Protoporphyrinogen oxidase [Gammaproteobacteria bacterium]|jgi:hypothetical protein|nr:Protoporphyrinogen oxidase [Gammaproteobacteria bacterium]
MKRIAVIGAGWYGCHIAIELSKQGNIVTLFEKNNKIVNELSGNFGVRLHLGLHYPRSRATRESCLTGYEEFTRVYPDLVNEHQHSIYALGDFDASGEKSKIDKDSFEALEKEHHSYNVIDPENFGYKNLVTAIDTQEGSIVVGKKLRNKLTNYLDRHNVAVRLNTGVSEISRNKNEIQLIVNGQSEIFDKVINATSFQQFTPNIGDLFDMRVAYQICIGLIYEDTQEEIKGKPNPFIVMDGWFPCFMAYDDGENSGRNRYLLYHGSYCILETYQSAVEARSELYRKLNDKKEEMRIESSARQHLIDFYPEFSERFRYIGWKGNVVAKVVTDTEFRNAFVFEDVDTNIIHVFPGKIPNVFDVGREVAVLVNEVGNDKTIQSSHYRFVQGGILDNGKKELSEKPKDISRNTCFLKISGDAQKSMSKIPTVENLIGLSGIFSKNNVFDFSKDPPDVSSMPNEIDTTLVSALVH